MELSMNSLIEFANQLLVIVYYARPHLSEAFLYALFLFWVFIFFTPIAYWLSKCCFGSRLILSLYSLIFATLVLIIIHAIFYQLGLGQMLNTLPNWWKSIILTLSMSFMVANCLIMPILGFTYPIKKKPKGDKEGSDTGFGDIVEEGATHLSGSPRSSKTSSDSNSASEFENPLN